MSFRPACALLLLPSLLLLLLPPAGPPARAADPPPADPPAATAEPPAAMPPPPRRPRLPPAPRRAERPGQPSVGELILQGESVVKAAERSGCAEGSRHIDRLREVTRQLDLGRRSDRMVAQGWAIRLARACG